MFRNRLRVVRGVCQRCKRTDEAPVAPDVLAVRLHAL